MTDEELIAQLRNSKGWPTYGLSKLGNAAAGRIEALIAEREKDHANINLKADFIDKTINQLTEAEAKIAKAAELLILCRDMFDEVAHPSDPLSVMLNETIAEIKGETK
jgi:hypothetical protein